MTAPRRAPAPARDVPDDWIELSDTFVDEVKLGVHPGWQWLGGPPDRFGGEVVMFNPGDGSPVRGWAVHRQRVLASPIPVNGVSS